MGVSLSLFHCVYGLERERERERERVHVPLSLSVNWSGSRVFLGEVCERECMYYVCQSFCGRCVCVLLCLCVCLCE